MVNTNYLTRGSIAKHLKLNPETLRYYESKGFIKKPGRLSNNYRIYNNKDMDKLKFIIMAKSLGFSLKEIKELLSLSLDEKTNRTRVRALTTLKSQLIAEKIKQLNAIKTVLDKLIKACQTQKTAGGCPILDSLHQKG
jgi:DNA-binding transcriptional MerR regulator